MSSFYARAGLFLFSALLVGLTACSRETPAPAPATQAAAPAPGSNGKVVVYAAVDQIIAEKVLKTFAEKTGIEVLPVYDVEAAKTTGLVSRLVAEKDTPRADVFWNGECVQTLELKAQGVLEPIDLGRDALAIDPRFRDADQTWYGCGGRIRVLLVNTDMVKEADMPNGLMDLLTTSIPKNRIAIAKPLFGTTMTHASALYNVMGTEKATALFTKLKSDGVQFATGNATVRDMVVDGRAWIGLTDSDDAAVALKKKAHVKVIFPDQDGIGTLIVPITVARVKGGANAANAAKLMKFLLGSTTGQMLEADDFAQVDPISLQTFGAVPHVKLKVMNVDLPGLHQSLPTARQLLTPLFLQ